MSVVIEVFETDAIPGQRRYVWWYDPEAFDGAGVWAWTDNINEAKDFPDFRAAFEFWRQPSKTRPLRDDGRPNRPLTAKTVQIVEKRP